MTAPQGAEVVDESAVRDLIGNLRGLPPDGVSVNRLSGGVSAAVFRVDLGTESMVVKQSRAVLDVPWVWEADPGRSAFEAAALGVFGDVTPSQVPKVLKRFDEWNMIILEAAPIDWANYKAALLSGGAPAAVSGIIGRTLAKWHEASLDDASIQARFERPRDLEDLRIRPYFTAAAENRPELSELMLGASAFLRRPGRCLVHGDATPKNVLFSPRGDQAWLLDPEVAHFGQPELDVAMWLSHLLLKVHRSGPAAAVALEALRAFIDAYCQQAPSGLLDEAALGLLITAVVQGRFHGLSRVDYIREIDLLGLNRALAYIAEAPEASLRALVEFEVEAA